MHRIVSSVWIPPEGVTTHAGSSILRDLDFFVAPPTEIGRVVSAYSTLKVSTQPLPPIQRFFRSFLIGIGFAVLTWLILKFFQVQSYLIVLAIGAIAAAFTYFIFLIFHHTCSYVGERGIVEYSIHGSRLAQPPAKLMCFKDAANLHTQQTRRYRNGSYQGTYYTYTWQMIGQKEKAYQLSGVYHSEKGYPDDKSDWHFANAAEASWSNYLLQEVNQQFQRLGYVEFPHQGNLRAVRVGNEFLEFVLKDGSIQKVAVADMKDIKLKSGWFYFRHKDARWWSKKGKYEFSYSSLPNAQLFLLCLKRLAGIRWS